MEFIASIVVMLLQFDPIYPQMCNSLQNVRNRMHGKRLPESVYLTFEIPGLMLCAKSCLVRSKCLSVNFNPITRKCELNNRTVVPSAQELISAPDFEYIQISEWSDKIAGSCAGHPCPSNSACDPVDEFNFTCVTSCESFPAINNGQLTSEISHHNQVGATLNHTCDTGFLTRDVITCRSDGTWNADVCIPATSCGVIKQHQPDSEDGEYWIRLPSFSNYLTRIFCLGMATSSPQEFLTLKNTNYGNYPMVSNKFCKQETTIACSGQGGQMWFRKISVDVNTMQVDVTDLTFANYSNNPRHMVYGHAHDCYTEHPDNDRCGVKGFFRIDLRGTGWKVMEDQEWEPYGHKSAILSIERQYNNSYIELRCGGYGGGCRPVSELLHLDPFPEDGPNIK